MAGAGSSRVGGRFGHYELRMLLGRGGMGEVYAAYDTVKDRTVALKLLPRELAADPLYQERFRREARTAARLQEPHVIPIHDFGEIDGILFIDMRLVEGQDLRSLLQQVGRLEPARAVHLIGQVASALDAAHRDGLVHRDVKPENVLVTAGDFAYLADFGIASRADDSTLTEQGSAIGSVAYMAPERFDDGPVTAQTDVYALGAVLHECLTGKTLFPAKTISAQIRAHLYDPPPPVSSQTEVPSGMDDVLARALAKDPRDRQPSAGAMAHEAGLVLSGQHWAQATTAGVRIDPSERGAPPRAETMAGAVRDTRLSSAPLPVGPESTPSRQRVRAWGLPVVATLLVVAVAALGAVAIWPKLSSDRAPAAAAAPGAPASTPSPSLTPSPSTPSASIGSAPAAAVTTTVTVPPQTTTTPADESTTSDQETTGADRTELSGAGYDRQGWNEGRLARCNYIDPAVVVAQSESARMVICETADGGYYYRGYQVKNNRGTELQHPVPRGDGWRATYKTVHYDLGPRELVISDQNKEYLREPMQVYASAGPTD